MKLDIKTYHLITVILIT